MTRFTMPLTRALPLALGCTMAVAQVPADAPVVIYTARKVITMEHANPEAAAVAVTGSRIVTVGSLEQVKAALGDRPSRIDMTFADKIVMPGFIDQHLHPVLGALTLSSEVIAPEDWVLPGRTFTAAHSPAEYRARLKAAEAAMKNGKQWLFSWGYHAMWHGKLDRATLDRISRKRPIVVWQRSCHEFYLNTAAIEALGFTKAAMAGHGTASAMINFAEGHWWEQGAVLILPQMLKAMATPERMVAGLRQLVAYLHQNGVTAYNEPGATFTPSMWTLYQQILGDPATPLYSFFIPSALDQANGGMGAAESLADTEKRVALAPSGKLRFFPQQIKLFADGAIISQLMQMKDGYLDGHHGEWLMQPETLEERARLYWDAGYQLHIHVNGDAGLEVLLGILERRMREQPRADHRSVIVHFANSTNEQVGRIARLGAIVSANPYYPVGFADMYGRIGLGTARADVMVRAGSLARHGVPLSYHSDLPMAPSDPLFLAWCGVNRITGSGRVAGPEQRIDVDHALRAVTIEAAYSWRKEHELGSIAPGKIANFTVLEQDPYAVEPVKLREIPVWGTVFEGRVFPVPAEHVRARVAAARAAAAALAAATQAPSGSAGLAELSGRERAALAVSLVYGHPDGGAMAARIVDALGDR